MNYFGPYGELELDDKGIASNSILFTAEYYMLKILLNQFQPSDIVAFQKMLAFLKNGNEYSQSFNDLSLSSHDNETGIFSMLYHMGLKDFANVNIWKWEYLNPNDFGFYCFVKGGWYKILYYLLLPVFSLALIYNSIGKYSISPYFWNWWLNFDIGDYIDTINTMNSQGTCVGYIKHYKSKSNSGLIYQRTYSLATSDILLAFLLFNTINMPITRKICEFLFKRRLGNKPYKQAFDLYFSNPNHPNHLLADQLWR